MKTGALAAAIGLLVVLTLAGCGAVAEPGNSGELSPSPPPASGEVIGQGTVLAKDGGSAMLCLGGVMESYPPQCSGPEIIGWDWEAVEGAESASGVMWGTYAVQGTWDGSAFTVTQPALPLSLYDPPAFEDPRLAPDNPGAGNEQELLRLQEDIHQAQNTAVLTSHVENGYIFVSVIYDDGTLQDAYNSEYGENIIAVQSALRPAG